MLSKFKLVGTDGLKGLNYKGDHIDFAQIDDTLAEQLYGKTHVLQRVEEAPAVAQLQAASEPVAVEAEAPTSRRRNS